MNQSLLRPTTAARSLAGREKCFGTADLGCLAVNLTGDVEMRRRDTQDQPFRKGRVDLV